MDTKNNFTTWIQDQATSEDLLKILEFCNQNCGTNFNYNNVIHLKNSISQIIHGKPTKDDLLNWLEDQDLDFLLRVAKSINQLPIVPIWKNIEEETFSTLISGIEDNHFINQEILQKSIKNNFFVKI